jgi:hypothetical protein
MGQKLDQARYFDALASEATTLAEGQALHARADRLRRSARGLDWLRQPLLRN